MAIAFITMDLMQSSIFDCILRITRPCPHFENSDKDEPDCVS